VVIEFFPEIEIVLSLDKRACPPLGQDGCSVGERLTGSSREKQKTHQHITNPTSPFHYLVLPECLSCIPTLSKLLLELGEIILFAQYIPPGKMTKDDCVTS
jgi:hypothetical protein